MLKSKKESFNMKITEGYMPYLGYKTYYRIVGESIRNKILVEWLNENDWLVGIMHTGRHGGRPYEPFGLKECFLQIYFKKIVIKQNLKNI